MTANSFDTPEQVMRYAIEGRLSKHSLATLLNLQPRRVFLDACAAIEKKYTDDCAAAKDPCLESGCSAEGERCLQPLLRAGTEYHRACGAEWVKLFADRENRLSTWRLAVSDIDSAA
jgi:hypothetical protein